MQGTTVVLRENQRFAGYLILEELGRGGMGVVYRAEHPRLPGKTVALKVLDPLRAGRRSLELFGREADLVSRLSHPNIVAVQDKGCTDSVWWIEMQYVDGTDAGAVLRNTPGGLDPARAVRFVCDAAAGLDYAHDNKVLHRDIKPSNLLVASTGGPERVLVADFGIARSLDEAATLTQAGPGEYSPDYVAPERFIGFPPDPRSDVYSLGATLHRLLTGSVPYPMRSDTALIQAHCTEPPPVPSLLRPCLPAGFDEVIALAMAKEPDERYQSCGELAAAALAALDTDPAHDDPAADIATRTSGPPAATKIAGPPARTRTSGSEAQAQAPEPHAQTSTSGPHGETRASKPSAEIKTPETGAQARTSAVRRETEASGPDAQAEPSESDAETETSGLRAVLRTSGPPAESETPAPAAEFRTSGSDAESKTAGSGADTRASRSHGETETSGWHTVTRASGPHPGTPDAQAETSGRHGEARASGSASQSEASGSRVVAAHEGDVPEASEAVTAGSGGGDGPVTGAPSSQDRAAPAKPKRVRRRLMLLVAAVTVGMATVWGIVVSPEQPADAGFTNDKAHGENDVAAQPLSTHCYWSVRVSAGEGSYVEVPSGDPGRDEPRCIFNTGDSSAAVTSLQRALALCHDTPLTVTGTYDPATRSAVRHLQLRYGADVDGIYGPQTRAQVVEWPVFRESDGGFDGRCLHLS